MARSSQKEWRKNSYEQRIDILKDCIKEISSISDQIIKLIVEEMGKPIAEGEEEIKYAVDDQDEYFDILLESMKPKQYGKCTVVRHPHGVVAIMSPWNYGGNHAFGIAVIGKRKYSDFEAVRGCP